MSLKIDFHCHTSASKDSLASLPELIRACHRRGVDRLVITDHNTIDMAQIAHSLHPELVIIGEEIMTTRGEILAAFVTQNVPPGLSPQETINRLRDQSAFISVSHPFDKWRKGAWMLEDLLEITPAVDAVEVFNSRCLFPRSNRQAQDFASLHKLPGTAGSDAHAAFEVGTATLMLPDFNDPEELRKVISQGIVRGRASPFWVHFISRYAHLYKKGV